MRFADVLGHEELKSRLRMSVANGRVAHAQLLVGEAGYGTLPIALAYAQYLNCPNRTAEDSCGECQSCHQMSELAHPDLHLAMPINKQGKKSGEQLLSKQFMPLFREKMSEHEGYLTPDEWYEAMELGKTLKGAIAVAEADEIIRTLSYKSYSGGYKVMVIWLPEMMSEEAANKLLKILEEPWERTLFLMVTESAEQLLATILSRTQRVEVGRIEQRALEQYAATRGITDSHRLHSIVHLSAGDYRSLKSLLSGEGGEQRAAFMELFMELMRLSYNDKHMELIEWAERVGQLPRAEQLALLRYSMEMLREAYIRHAGLSELCYTWGEEANFSTKFAPFIGNENIEFLMQEIELAVTQLSQNANPTILFTHFALLVSKQIKRR